MEQYRKTGIKEVIASFPAVAEILEGYGIACAPCTVGTCNLEDVVKVHGLPPQEEAKLASELAQAIQAGAGKSASPTAPGRSSAPQRQVTYSPPLQRLVDEHTWIKRLLALIPALTEEMRASGEIDRELVRGALDFIRGYADRFHHMKEEDILFDYADREAEIIRVIQEDHERARGFVRAAARAAEEGDVRALWATLMAYRDLLTEHISKEDDVLYPYIDRGLSTHQVGEVFRRFEEAESAAGKGAPGEYQRFIVALERRFHEQRKETE